MKLRQVWHMAVGARWHCGSGRGDIGLRGVREPLPRGKRRLVRSGGRRRESGEALFLEGVKAQNLRAVRQDWGVGYKGCGESS
jgi:hypothetical protein